MLFNFGIQAQISIDLIFNLQFSIEDPRSVGTADLGLRDGLPTGQLLNQAASDVADGDVTFLDALRVV